MGCQSEVYFSFCSMKRLGVFLLPPGWDASSSQGYPQHFIRWYPFIHLGRERHCERSCRGQNTTQCPRAGSSIQRRGTNQGHRASSTLIKQSLSNVLSTITAEIFARPLANFYCPVIDNEFRQNIVKVVRGSTRLSPCGSTATLTMLCQNS